MGKKRDRGQDTFNPQRDTKTLLYTAAGEPVKVFAFGVSDIRYESYVKITIGDTEFVIDRVNHAKALRGALSAFINQRCAQPNVVGLKHNKVRRAYPGPWPNEGHSARYKDE